MFTSILRKLQDFGWLIALLVLAYIAYRVIPAIDPRSGIDGFGDLFAALVLAVKGVMATILAWACKSLYWWEPADAVDAQWHADYERTGQRELLTLIIKDRVEYAAWLAFWLFVLF